jgi:hypothetical protein
VVVAVVVFVVVVFVAVVVVAVVVVVVIVVFVVFVAVVVVAVVVVVFVVFVAVVVVVVVVAVVVAVLESSIVTEVGGCMKEWTQKAKVSGRLDDVLFLVTYSQGQVRLIKRTKLISKRFAALYQEFRKTYEL